MCFTDIFLFDFLYYFVRVAWSLADSGLRPSSIPSTTQIGSGRFDMRRSNGRGPLLFDCLTLAVRIWQYRRRLPSSRVLSDTGTASLRQVRWVFFSRVTQNVDGLGHRSSSSKASGHQHDRMTSDSPSCRLCSSYSMPVN
jgi:hypothetical protein